MGSELFSQESLSETRVRPIGRGGVEVGMVRNWKFSMQQNRDQKYRWVQSIKFFSLMFLLVVQYQNCSQYGGANNFDSGDSQSASTSTALSAVTPRLDSPMGVLDMNEYQLNLSVAGDCNIGLATKHYIELTLQDSTNNLLPVREDSLCPEKGTNLSVDCYRARQFQCEHGRYNVILPINCSHYFGIAQSVYRLVGQLVTVSDAGAETRNSQAKFDRFFTVNWASNSCP